MSGNVDATGAQRKAHRDYIVDQLQQMRTATDHAAILQSRASARIGEAQKALAPFKEADAGDLSRYHAVERMLDERAFYPPHDKRKEAPAYAKVHRQMTVTDDKACLVCGVRHSTLGDVTKNPFGAVQIKTHHHTIEWALANAVDAVKFNKHIRPGLKRQAEARKARPNYPTQPKEYTNFDELYANDMSIEDIRHFVDHGADNLWVLCDVHQRHKFVGIHAITFPIWGPQDVVEDTLVAQSIKTAMGGRTVSKP